MKLFSPDYFSTNHDNKKNKSIKLSEDFIKNFEFAYSSLGKISSVNTMPGLEINSKNLKICTPKGDWVLKYWKSKDYLKPIRTCNLMNSLSDKGIVVPQPVKNHLGDYCSTYDGQIYSIFSFLNGEDFFPSARDISPYLESAGSLFNALRKVELNLLDLAEIPDSNLIIKYLYSSLSSNNELIKKFALQFANLKKISYKIEKDSETYMNLKNSGKFQYCHNDLHPKNILKTGDCNFGFLDFEACVVYDPNISWGFTLIKILRQIVSSAEQSVNPKKLGFQTLNKLIHIPFAKNLLIETLPTFGRIEILKRLTYILRDYELNGSTLWQHMLPVQINVLLESYEIFD